MLQKFKLLGFALSSVALIACSDDDTSGSNGAVAIGSSADGQFLDSAVINIGYRTESGAGVTDGSGSFNFLIGETVTFFIGDLILPTTTANSAVTALDIAKTSDATNTTVVNINRLLQSLDKDGDPNNGIEITEQAKLSAAMIDFSQSVLAFEADPSLINLVNNGGQDAPELVSADSATAHFIDTLAGISSSGYKVEIFNMVYTNTDAVTSCRARATPAPHNLVLVTATTESNNVCSLLDVPQVSCDAVDITDTTGVERSIDMYYDFGSTVEDNIRGQGIRRQSDGTISGLWVINFVSPIDGSNSTTDCGPVVGTKL